MQFAGIRDIQDVQPTRRAGGLWVSPRETPNAIDSTCSHRQPWSAKNLHAGGVSSSRVAMQTGCIASS